MRFSQISHYIGFIKSGMNTGNSAYRRTSAVESWTMKTGKMTLGHANNGAAFLVRPIKPGQAVYTASASIG